MSLDNERKSRGDRVYHEVMALYLALKDNPNGIRVKRAEMRQGEVKAEPIDFLADVEIKATRYINSLGNIQESARKMWQSVLRYPDTYPHLYIVIREGLGKMFDIGRLGVDGDYKMLFFRAKNNQERKPREVTSGDDDTNTGTATY